MATTTAAVGATLVAGFRTHTNDWNTVYTGAALTTGDALELHPDISLAMRAKYSPNAGIYGGIGLPRVGLSVESYETVGSIKVNGRFLSAISRLFALFFGAETTALVAGAAYSHLFTWTANSQYLGTFAYFANLLCHDFPMVKVSSLTFTFETGKIPVVEIGLIGKREYIDGTGANTAGGMVVGTVTLPAGQPAILYPIWNAANGVVRLVDPSSTVLASTTHDKFPSKIVINYKRKPPTIQTNRNNPYPDEPIYNDGDLEADVTLTFPYISAAAEWSRMAAQTETHMDMTITGSALGGSNYKWNFEWPCAIPASDGVPVPSSSGLLGYDLKFSCYEALDNPSGQAFNRPRMTITDNVTNNHLTNGV